MLVKYTQNTWSTYRVQICGIYRYIICDPTSTGWSIFALYMLGFLLQKVVFILLPLLILFFIAASSLCSLNNGEAPILSPCCDVIICSKLYSIKQEDSQEPSWSLIIYESPFPPHKNHNSDLSTGFNSLLFSLFNLSQCQYLYAVITCNLFHQKYCL